MYSNIADSSEDGVDGFLIIPSEKISNYVDKIPVHINATNIQELITAPNGRANVSLKCTTDISW